MLSFLKNQTKNLQDSKNYSKFASAIERETLSCFEDGPFVYRLVLKIFILARGVRFPHGLLGELIQTDKFFFYAQIRI